MITEEGTSKSSISHNSVSVILPPYMAGNGSEDNESDPGTGPESFNEELIKSEGEQIQKGEICPKGADVRHNSVRSRALRLDAA